MIALSSIRANLIAIVVATVVPAVAALGMLGYILFENQKNQVEIDMRQTTRALAAALDREFAIALNVARTLAASDTLARGDLAAFHVLATNALGDHFAGFNFVLSDPSGQQLVNTIRPFGEPLPRHGNLAIVHKVVETGKPTVSNLYLGGVLRTPVISVDVPVFRYGKVAYVLSVGLRTPALSRLLADQNLPQGRMAAVFDPTGVIAARTHREEEFVGKKGIPELVSRLQTEADGIVEAHTLEGQDVIIAFSKSAATAWSVGISTPWTVVLTETLDRITAVFTVAVLLLLGGVGMAWVIGGNISRSIRALTASVKALGRGDAVEVLTHGPKEAIEVSRTLKAVELQLRTYRDHVETLVVERTAALEMSNRELEQFAYVVSHDLQEPLRMVVSYVDLLSRRYGDRLDADARDFIGFAREGALRMSDLISDLLQYSRIGRHDEGPELVDLGDAARKALENLRVALDESGGEVVVGSLPVVRGHEAELVSLLQNLLGNALKFRKPGQAPRVDLGGRRSDGSWIITVADNGIGIAPEYHDRIFNLFQRLHVRSQYGGTGIGLTSCKKIVERHGGRIWVESREGEGCTFSFSLPATDGN